MSKIDEQVFDRLKADESPEVVRKSVSSASRFTKGVQRYLAWAEPQVRELQKEMGSLSIRKQELTSSVQSLQTQHQELTKNIENLNNKQSELARLNQEQKSRLGEQKRLTEQAKTELKGLQAQIQELAGKGYTPELVSKLSASDAASGGELLQRVQTIQKYEAEVQALKSTLQNRAKEREKAENELSSLNSKLQAEREEARKATNRLRQRRDQERLFEASIKIVKLLMEKYGLQSQDLENMLSLIKMIGAPDMPGHTMENAKKMIEEYRTLTKLESAIKGRKETLEKAEAEIGKAEERLGASTKAFTDLSRKIEQLINNIQATARRVGDDVNATLQRLEASTTANLEKASEKAREGIDATGNAAAQTIASIRLQGEAALKSLVKECSKILTEIQSANEEERKQHRAQMEEWGRIQTEAGKLEEELRLARVVEAAIKYPSEVKDLPIDYALLLHEAASKFCSAKDVNPKVKAGDALHSKYYSIPSYVEVDLLDIMEWAERGLSEAAKAK